MLGLVAAILGVIFLSSCDSTEMLQLEDDIVDTSPSTDSTLVNEADSTHCSLAPVGNSIFPLATGNRWEYLRLYDFGDGRTQWRTDTMFVEVKNSLERSGRETPLFEVRRFYPHTRRIWYLLYGEDQQNIEVAGGYAEGDTLTTLNSRYKHPLQVGQSYDWVEHYYSSSGWISINHTSELIAKDSKISTPSGDHIASVYRYYLPSSDDVFIGNYVTEFVTEGIGLVAEGYSGEDNPDFYQFIYLLNDYCLVPE